MAVAVRRYPSALLALAATAVAWPGAARAHDAASGWSYPHACCSGFDCREVPASIIGEGPQGYIISRTGEVVDYGDRRVRNSPDGKYHWCSVAGADDGDTICLFVPPKLF
jgi:hypothetical protein